MYTGRRDRDGILNDLERVQNMLSGYKIEDAHLKLKMNNSQAIANLVIVGCIIRNTQF